MIGPRNTASGGSTAVGGDNKGAVVNVNAAEGATVAVQVDSANVTRRLPTHLAAVISQFAKSAADLLADALPFAVKPAIEAKLAFNNLPKTHRIIRDWTKHARTLHKSYQGVEQVNQAARYLVKRKAGVVYDEELHRICHEKGVSAEQQREYARQHAMTLVQAVTGRLMHEYSCSAEDGVEAELAHLAVSLVVADAVIECEVLERPENAATT